MRKELKVGEYVIFDRNGKKTGKAKIHGFVLIDGILHAVFTYYIDGVIKHIRTLPVEIEENADAIHFGGAGCYLTADAPVLPKLVKFKVGEIYTNNDDDKFRITDKYSNCLNGSMHLVLNDEIVADVKPDDDGIEHAEFYDGDDFKEIVAGKFTEDEEE